MPGNQKAVRPWIDWDLRELGERAAPPAPSAKAGEVHLKIAATDGYPLAATLFEPQRPNRITVQINPAYAVPREYYAAYARYLALRGFTVLTYDYRGTGGSRESGWNGDPPTMRHWGERDLAAVIDWAARRYPAYRHVHVGHSAGGQMLGLAPNNRKVDALLAIASQSGPWQNWDFPHNLVSAAWFYAVVPAVAALSGLFPPLKRGGFDVPRGVALQWARWGRGPHYISDDHGRPLREHFERFSGHVRLYHITDDAEFAPRRAVEALARLYTNARVEVIHRAPADWGVARIGHFGFFRDSMPRLAWEETARWLAGRLPAPQRIPAAAPAALEEEYA